MENLETEGKMIEVPPGSVQISPEKQQRIGVRTGTAEVRRLEKNLRTVGRVDYDEKKVMTVSPKIGGWIEDLYVDVTGQFVKKGEPLLTIYSPELVAAQEEYLLALRAKRDLMHSRIPEVAESGRSLTDSARQRLKLWDITDAQIAALEKNGKPSKTVTLYSPYSGFVLEKMVFNGMNIMPGMVLFKLADLSQVWVFVDIYENELPLIQSGQQASIRLSYLPGESFVGKAAFVYPSLDPATRTGKVRFEFPNPRERLKPGMFANVEIRVDLGEKLVVPQEAVIDTGIRKVVLIDRGSGLFEPREIQTGAGVNNDFEVLEGLKAGERVVTSANFLIDSESRFKEAVGGMAGHSH
jgi:membrane fusion protein, copper/silver efflux system